MGALVFALAGVPALLIRRQPEDVGLLPDGGALPPAGFKIGATGRQMQAYLGIASPIAGFVLAADVLASPATVRFADFIRPGVECEIGVRLGRDIAPGPCSREDAAAAVAEVFPAIEIVEQRYADMSALHTPTVVADQMFHGEGLGSELLGHPMAALAWLAGSPCAAVFGGLKAGQVVFLGSVTPPHWVQGPGRVEVEFDGLGRAELTFS